LLWTAAEEFMTVQDFIHRHYSPAVGESPTGHAIAVLAGLALIVIGAALVVSVVFLPAGIAIGVLGVLMFGAGVFAHITSPLTFADLMDAVIGLSGAAITLTIAIAIAAIVAGFGITVVVSLFRWLAS
jgi:membrane-bound ClpP family serine protease